MRHCQTDWNKAGRIQGHTDNQLNGEGKNQAQRLSLKLKRYKFYLIVSSDLLRALETAAIIGMRTGAPVRPDKRLRERSYGSLEGMTWAEIENERKVKKSDFSAAKGYDLRPYGGESRKQVIDRHLDLLEELKKEYGGKTVVLVGHGSSLGSLLVRLGNRHHYLEMEKIVVAQYRL
ncbi:MAG: histidine phosphatase family protein [Patescibacteria group bacterium]